MGNANAELISSTHNISLPNSINVKKEAIKKAEDKAITSALNKYFGQEQANKILAKNKDKNLSFIVQSSQIDREEFNTKGYKASITVNIDDSKFGQLQHLNTTSISNASAVIKKPKPLKKPDTLLYCQDFTKANKCKDVYISAQNVGDFYVLFDDLRTDRRVWNARLEQNLDKAALVNLAASFKFKNIIYAEVGYNNQIAVYDLVNGEFNKRAIHINELTFYIAGRK